MIRTLLVAALLASSTAAVMAQGQGRSGTPDEQKACAKDVSRYCRSVMDQSDLVVLSCLQQHSARLSAPCQQAVAALGTSGAPAAGAGAATAATPPATRPAAMPVFSPREEMMIVRETCGPDFRAFCRAVPIGGGRVISCLRDNLQRVSPACHRVLTSGL